MTAPSWLEELLADAQVTDICLNGERAAHFDRGNAMEPVAVPNLWPEGAMLAWIIEQLSAVGKSWDAKNPFVDATLLSGHRLHAAFPPMSRTGLLISLRRLATPTAGVSRWEGSRLLTPLRDAVLRGESVLIAGATGSGKTTLASDLLAALPARERVIALEDTPELAPAHPHFISLLSRPPNSDGFGEVTLRTLLRQALRMRPDRVVLGECRGPEVLDLLQTLNTGHRGSIATLHANSPRDALKRVELLCLLTLAGQVPPVVIRELISSGLQWVSFVRREGGKRTITELWKIEGREGDAILMRPWS